MGNREEVFFMYVYAIRDYAWVESNKRDLSTNNCSEDNNIYRQLYDIFNRV